MKTLDYNNLIVMFDNIENENMLLKSNLKLFEETIRKKDTEITVSLNFKKCMPYFKFYRVRLNTIQNNVIYTKNCC